MNVLRIAIMMVGAVAVSTVVAQGPMREGQWETTVEIQMANMPMQMPPVKSTKCFTSEDLKDPNNALTTGPDAKSSCKVSDYKTEGNRISWKVACTAPQQMTGTGELLFAGDTYTGVSKMTMAVGEMTMKYSGKRLGDCKK